MNLCQGHTSPDIRSCIKDNVAASHVFLEQLSVDIRLWVTKSVQQPKRITSLVRKPKVER